ncbi:Putative transmembrane protein [Xanthomarina gelatinilytica]|uniref:Putative transmembrane protein n=1 Tax=Xanthomarina gelatinilytica TaxID=1137281 RepID=M7NAG6_9FLAO|nr:hypothetical protein [Xanthomarina gelatinilytica]EMQ95483.1 Putative transmembrane protein [Xanthomarina gelatinilytica]
MKSNNLIVEKLLYYTFGIVPIVAGLDKFANILTDWTQYLSSGIVDMLPFEASTFMIVVGIIEIIAGVLVLLRPIIGSYVVMAWLILIALTLIFSGSFLDVAVRDLVMAIAAFSLAQLSSSSLIKAKN